MGQMLKRVLLDAFQLPIDAELRNAAFPDAFLGVIPKNVKELFLNEQRIVVFFRHVRNETFVKEP